MQKVSPFYAELLSSLGPETELNQRIYLVTMSRVLPTTVGLGPYRDLTTVTREDVGQMVKDAFDDPLATGAGGRPRAADRPSCVKFIAVAQEYHKDGSPHFHVVVRLGHRMRFHACEEHAPSAAPHRQPLVLNAFRALECRAVHPHPLRGEAPRRHGHLDMARTGQCR